MIYMDLRAYTDDKRNRKIYILECLPFSYTDENGENEADTDGQRGKNGMKTIWNGTHLIMEFDNGDRVSLDTEQTKEFEAWVLSRVEWKQRQDNENVV